jgi:hypothetical protein
MAATSNALRRMDVTVRPLSTLPYSDAMLFDVALHDGVPGGNTRALDFDAARGWQVRDAGQDVMGPYVFMQLDA